jgi:hypothetical protein
VHTALGRRFLVLLNGHFRLLGNGCCTGGNTLRVGIRGEAAMPDSAREASDYSLFLSLQAEVFLRRPSS